MRIGLFCPVVLFASIATLAAEDLTLDNVTQPPANTADEPVADEYSLDTAVRFLDQSSLDWTKRRKCFTCHTNYRYLLARPAISAENQAHQQVRAALEELVETRWEKQGPRWDAEVVMSAAVLAMKAMREEELTVEAVQERFPDYGATQEP